MLDNEQGCPNSVRLPRLMCRPPPVVQMQWRLVVNSGVSDAIGGHTEDRTVMMMPTMVSEDPNGWVLSMRVVPMRRSPLRSAVSM
jgi:hypothetical protein